MEHSYGFSFIIRIPQFIRTKDDPAGSGKFEMSINYGTEMLYLVPITAVVGFEDTIETTQIVAAALLHVINKETFLWTSETVDPPVNL